MVILYIYIDKCIFNYKIVNKIGPHFEYFFKGGGAERKWWKENVNHECLDDFRSTPKSVFCKAIFYIYIDKTQIVKNGPQKIGRGACGKKMVERKWKAENAYFVMLYCI